MNKKEKLEFDDFYEFKKNKKKAKYKITKKDFIYRILPIILIPMLVVLTTISTHSDYLIRKWASYIIYILLAFIIVVFVAGILFYKKRMFGKTVMILKVFFTIYIIGCSAFLMLLYGPIDNFKSWYISTGMATMNHQYLVKWFYSSKEINKVLNSNYIKEVDEETDKSLINQEKEVTYKNEYDKQILEHKKNDKYKIIELTVNGQKAYLAAVYDPSKVKVAVTKGLGSYGQYVTKMASDSKALLAVNGGGFYDPGANDRGGKPTGITIENGVIKSNNNYSTYTQFGGLIGMTNDNVLVLMKNTTGQKALAAGVRDAVSWGPFLIVNGKKSFIKGNGGWGYAARTAIGQREDGIILLLVVDSNSTRTRGADMVDLTEIMSNYGAINAANLDGGTSSVFVLPKKESLKYIDSCAGDYCYINDPVNANLVHKTRGIATSIVVTE